MEIPTLDKLTMQEIKQRALIDELRKMQMASLVFMPDYRDTVATLERVVKARSEASLAALLESSPRAICLEPDHRWQSSFEGDDIISECDRCGLARKVIRVPFCDVMFFDYFYR